MEQGPLGKCTCLRTKQPPHLVPQRLPDLPFPSLQTYFLHSTRRWYPFVKGIGDSNTHTPQEFFVSCEPLNPLWVGAGGRGSLWAREACQRSVGPRVACPASASCVLRWFATGHGLSSAASAALILRLQLEGETATGSSRRLDRSMAGLRRHLAGMPATPQVLLAASSAIPPPRVFPFLIHNAPLPVFPSLHKVVVANRLL